jgi:hypothetical protein
MSGGKLCALLMALKASKQIWPQAAASSGLAVRRTTLDDMSELREISREVYTDRFSASALRIISSEILTPTHAANRRAIACVNRPTPHPHPARTSPCRDTPSL